MNFETPHSAPRTSSKVVLVVEDDNLVRRLVLRILGAAGYEVLPAASGEEGLELFAANRDRIDVVLLDGILPGISGADVFRKLREAARDLPVVFCSGYGEQGVPAGADVLVLPKPYDRDALVDILERARLARGATA